MIENTITGIHQRHRQVGPENIAPLQLPFRALVQTEIRFSSRATTQAGQAPKWSAFSGRPPDTDADGYRPEYQPAGTNVGAMSMAHLVALGIEEGVQRLLDGPIDPLVRINPGLVHANYFAQSFRVICFPVTRLLGLATDLRSYSNCLERVVFFSTPAFSSTLRRSPLVFDKCCPSVESPWVRHPSDQET